LHAIGEVQIGEVQVGEAHCDIGAATSMTVFVGLGLGRQVQVQIISGEELQSAAVTKTGSAPGARSSKSAVDSIVHLQLWKRG
jgi:hypothetical protein